MRVDPNSNKKGASKSKTTLSIQKHLHYRGYEISDEFISSVSSSGNQLYHLDDYNFLSPSNNNRVLGSRTRAIGT